MGFSEKVKEEARRKSGFRCVICQEPFVEVHHIIPQSEGGEDTIENAAPLPFVPDVTIYMETTLQKENRSVR